MKIKYPKPCEHLDTEIGYRKEGAPCEDEPCDWCYKNIRADEEWFDPCRRRYMVTEDDTIDMFDEASHED